MTRQRLVNETISASHLDLLKRALDRVKEKRASVSMFERFGLSGAVLYRLTPPGAIPYVVKVDSVMKIEREYAAASGVRNKFDDLHVEKPVGPTREGQKALLYRLISAQGGVGRVVELKHKYELALRPRVAEPDEHLSEVITAIQRTYTKFSVAHVFTEKGDVRKFKDQYGGYVRLRNNSTDRLSRLFESHEAPLVAYGMKFTNPRGMIERVLDVPLRPLWVGATHGDLHLSNVVFSSSGDPRLIDFAHAGCDQHLFKDFVMMESSLRFMMFPRHIHPGLLGPVDVALNEHWSCDVAGQIVAAAAPSEGARALAAMIACVRAVREACDRALQGGPVLTEEAKKEEYFRCLSLLLLGLQQFDTYPLVRVAVNLHLLGTRYV
ncbi:MAG: hypothetical protein JWM27_4098 [Gemmatimonadetes bacterium]|nr:hypothetical protein [Gemmatimonadota bacterium]